ncbi:MAG: hypothetical protein QG575_401 [Euryarchaeota archaeon]|nr:hypothetical protein [Euryarchaeota archaeon]
MPVNDISCDINPREAEGLTGDIFYKVCPKTHQSTTYR